MQRLIIPLLCVLSTTGLCHAAEFTRLIKVERTTDGEKITWSEFKTSGDCHAAIKSAFVPGAGQNLMYCSEVPPAHASHDSQFQRTSNQRSRDFSLPIILPAVTQRPTMRKVVLQQKVSASKPRSPSAHDALLLSQPLPPMIGEIIGF